MMTMTEDIGGISFPVVFCDGECESEIGNVVVFPAMEYKRFQAILSEKIGISPNQFSVFISSPESRRRIPITSKINFGVLSRQSSCFFLVVLKRTKRERRRRRSSQLQILGFETASFCSSIPAVQNPLENAVFLRRWDTGSGYPLFSGRVDWENRVRGMEMEKERYLMSMGLQASGYGPGPNVVCEECCRAEEMGEEVGFHWCAYDPVVSFRFRSPAGPISRPDTRLKRSE